MYIFFFLFLLCSRESGQEETRPVQLAFSSDSMHGGLRVVKGIQQRCETLILLMLEGI